MLMRPQAIPDAAAHRGFRGDRRYIDATLQEQCAERAMVTTQRGRYLAVPRRGRGGRRVFHKLRSAAIETFNGQFKAIFDCRGQVPTKGRVATRRFVFGRGAGLSTDPPPG